MIGLSYNRLNAARSWIKTSRFKPVRIRVQLFKKHGDYRHTRKSRWCPKSFFPKINIHCTLDISLVTVCNKSQISIVFKWLGLGHRHIQRYSNTTESKKSSFASKHGKSNLKFTLIYWKIDFSKKKHEQRIFLKLQQTAI